MTQLEEWCRTNQLHDKNVVQQLEPITEVVQLLQVNKKSLEDVDGIIAIVKHLNALQVSDLFFGKYILGILKTFSILIKNFYPSFRREVLK